jgi:predicted nuclease of predicted toxin-antitoxin system
MKFLADMGISPVTVAWLKQQGHDAIHLSEERLHKLSDREIFNKADREDRIVLTTDLDFGEIAISASSAKISVIIFRQEDRTPTSVNQYLEKVIGTAKTDLEKGAIITVQVSRIRIRHLSRN